MVGFLHTQPSLPKFIKHRDCFCEDHVREHGPVSTDAAYEEAPENAGLGFQGRFWLVGGLRRLFCHSCAFVPPLVSVGCKRLLI